MSREVPTPGLPRPVLVVAIALGALLAVSVAALGLYVQHVGDQERQAQEAAQKARRTGPLALPPIPAAEAGTPECAKVVAALPRDLRLGESPVPRRALAEPVPPATVVWGDAEHDPVTVRCGIDAPAELTPTSKLVDISGVSWLEISEGGRSSWLAVDRPVYVALTVPAGSGSGPVQDLSQILRDTLPKQPVFP
ncbi:DUF3515 domain-containing protein [Saccharopolyspora erythraea]|uniref:DUF3515 domain-containing protein n=1 Tax=Saccharopolyspora erythraea TaxID=1836 RepID=UPI001E2B03B0|nr:DUF3515 domain-containing protein [Saccharopolyspora erythraea]